jgi:hypothetical protein
MPSQHKRHERIVKLVQELIAFMIIGSNVENRI